MSIPDDYYCRNGSNRHVKAKVLLVYPKVGADAKGVSLYPPLSALYLACAMGDYPVVIYDQRVDEPEKFERLLADRPICVGFSIFTGRQITYALELAEKVKARGIPTVFGGVHTTIMPQQTQADERVDYAIGGDGEQAFRQLVAALEKNQFVEPVITNVPVDLDGLDPLPYEMVDIEEYVASSAMEGRSLPVLFSRGCPFECTFCCNPVISRRRWQTTNVDLAAEQTIALAEKYKLDGVIFWDENLLVNKRIICSLAERIDGRFKWFAQARVNSLLQYDLNWLEKMGAARLACGIESGSPAILKKIKKGETVEEYIEANRRLAKTNINVWYNYITGYPFETLDDLKQTIRLALQMLDDNPNANNNTFYLLTPYPGTEIGEEYLKSEMPGTLAGWAEFGRHNYSARWHPPEMLKLYERIAFSSKFVGRRILRLFGEHAELQRLVAAMTEKWQNFDFDDEAEWQGLRQDGWAVLKELFGENAY